METKQENLFHTQSSRYSRRIRQWIFETISIPLQTASGLMVDMENFMKQLEEAKKKSAMEKEKSEKRKRKKEAKEKNTKKPLRKPKN